MVDPPAADRSVSGNPWTEVLVRAGWAPLGALVLHWGACALGCHVRADNLVHFSGGAAAAYFALRWCQIFAPRIGTLREHAVHAVGFGAGCTAAVFCEILEFAADQALGTRTQISLRETMLDLVFGTLGAALAVLGTYLLSARSRRRGGTRAIDAGDPEQAAR